MKELLLATAIILGLCPVSLQLAIGPTVAQTLRSTALAGDAPVLFGNPRSEAAPRFLSESGRRFLLATLNRLIPPDRNSTMKVI
jgi:hypothetical protein